MGSGEMGQWLIAKITLNGDVKKRVNSFKKLTPLNAGSSTFQHSSIPCVRPKQQTSKYFTNFRKL
jgi:hypothetical protein